ncbi:MAG: SPOR domain-containing protein [Ignavibacteria bacterium]|nr:SPOR domain-containing protein [Ignavibacteria bacterium]
MTLNFRFYILHFRLRNLQLVTRNVKLSFFAFNILLLLLTSSCTSTEELRKREIAEERKTFLAFHESQFNPSDYLEEDFPDTIPTTTIDTVKEEEIPVEEMMSGFRVQVYLSQDIDSAKLFFQNVNPKLENDWVYIVFDAPLYRIRVGDFQDRVAAEEMKTNLIQLGFANAWIVPDRVRKFPPEKPLIEIPLDSLSIPDSLKH